MLLTFVDLDAVSSQYHVEVWYNVPEVHIWKKNMLLLYK